MSVTSTKSVLDIVHNIENQLALAKLDIEKLGNGNKSSAARIRSNFQDIAKSCGLGRKEILAIKATIPAGNKPAKPIANSGKKGK